MLVWFSGCEEVLLERRKWLPSSCLRDTSQDSNATDWEPDPSDNKKSHLCQVLQTHPPNTHHIFRCTCTVRCARGVFLFLCQRYIYFEVDVESIPHMRMPLIGAEKLTLAHQQPCSHPFFYQPSCPLSSFITSCQTNSPLPSWSPPHQPDCPPTQSAAHGWPCFDRWWQWWGWWRQQMWSYTHRHEYLDLD